MILEHDPAGALFSDCRVCEQCPLFRPAGSANSGALDGPMDAELPDVGSPRGDGGRGGLDLRSRLGDMPEV